MTSDFICSIFVYSQVRVGNETIKSNLQAYRYQFEENAMDNGFVDKRNKCFCRDGKWECDEFRIFFLRRQSPEIAKNHTSAQSEWMVSFNQSAASPQRRAVQLNYYFAFDILSFRWLSVECVVMRSYRIESAIFRKPVSGCITCSAHFY